MQASDVRADMEALSSERLKLQGQLSQLVDREEQLANAEQLVEGLRSEMSAARQYAAEQLHSHFEQQKSKTSILFCPIGTGDCAAHVLLNISACVPARSWCIHACLHDCLYACLCAFVCICAIAHALLCRGSASVIACTCKGADVLDMRCTSAHCLDSGTYCHRLIIEHRAPCRMVSLSLDPSGAQALAEERTQLEKERDALNKQDGCLRSSSLIPLHDTLEQLGCCSCACCSQIICSFRSLAWVPQKFKFNSIARHAGTIGCCSCACCSQITWSYGSLAWVTDTPSVLYT
eukprot:1159052-Pelagomonas_calceolata.AAC.8